MKIAFDARRKLGTRHRHPLEEGDTLRGSMLKHTVTVQVHRNFERRAHCKLVFPPMPPLALPERANSSDSKERQS